MAAETSSHGSAQPLWSARMDGSPPYRGPWQDGKKVVLLRDGSLGPRCAKCGELGTVLFDRKVSWASPWLLLLWLLSPLIWIIAVMIVSKRSRFEMWLCDEHAALRKRDRIIGWVGLGVLLASFFVLPALAPGAIGLLPFGAIGGLALAVYGYYRQRIITVVRIDDQYIRLGRVSPAVRSTLPAFSG